MGSETRYWCDRCGRERPEPELKRFLWRPHEHGGHASRDVHFCNTCVVRVVQDAISGKPDAEPFRPYCKACDNARELVVGHFVFGGGPAEQFADVSPCPACSGGAEPSQGKVSNAKG